MISKMFRVAFTIVLASFALSSTVWATCSNSSVTGIYGFMDMGTDSTGTPTASLDQLKFDSTTGKFTGTLTVSIDGLIQTDSVSGTYAVAPNCTVTGTSTVAGHKSHPFSAVVTSTGGVKEVDGHIGVTTGGFALAQGAPTCTNAGLKGSFGFAAEGVFVPGAPFKGPVELIAELAFSVNSSGEGVISGQLAGSENGTILTFAEEPVTGSYTVGSDCMGTATITPKVGSALNFSFVVVEGGKELMAIETDTDRVVTARFQR